MRSRSLLFLLACAGLLCSAGCRDDDDDDDAAIVDPGPGPTPGPQPDPEPPGPGPGPTPEPPPEPEPPPVPEPPPDPDPEPDPDPTPGVSGWIQQGNSGVHLFALSAVGSTHAWTSSSVDLLLGTTDGGETWTNLADQTFTQLKFLTELEGWAFNLDGAYFSGDGGHTWTRKLALEGFDGVAGASFLSPSTGWVLTGDGMLHKTTDTGETWTQVSIGRFAREIAFVNASVGWMITDGPTSATESIWKSTDGGATWNQQFTFGNETTFLSQLSALSATQVRVGGIREEDGSNVGVILSTNDGGVTWNSVVNGIPALTAMHFATPDLGWMVAGTHVFRTVNGGGTWTEQELPELVQHSPSSPFSGLFAITFVDAQTGYIVGDNGIILKTSSGGE